MKEVLAPFCQKYISKVLSNLGSTALCNFCSQVVNVDFFFVKLLYFVGYQKLLYFVGYQIRSFKRMFLVRCSYYKAAHFENFQQAFLI